MTTKGIAYLLSKLHNVWLKIELGLIFEVLPYSVPLFNHSAMAEAWPMRIQEVARVTGLQEAVVRQILALVLGMLLTV